MDKNRIPVITIDREYGAGGRTLAAILSERLDIPYYDRDFVAKTAEESGFDKEDVEREGEEMSRSSQILDHFLGGTVSYNSSHDRIFEAEKKVILSLAEEPCILVGRCASNILREAGKNPLGIYLHAPAGKRLLRAEELGEYGEMKPDKFLEKHDEQRRTYYKQYTGHEIFDAANYTFCFDTGKVDIPLCADIVINMLVKKYE